MNNISKPDLPDAALAVWAEREEFWPPFKRFLETLSPLRQSAAHLLADNGLIAVRETGSCEDDWTCVEFVFDDEKPAYTFAHVLSDELVAWSVGDGIGVAIYIERKVWSIGEVSDADEVIETQLPAGPHEHSKHEG